MGAIYQETIVFAVVTCYKCGISFGITEPYNDKLRQNGAEFFCPNGHGQVYKYKESIENQLRQTEANLKWWKEQAEYTARSLAATRGVLTKTKKRIANGVCPCCHRQFVVLARHMKNQHPDYVEEGEAK